MDKTILLQLICVILVGFLSISLVKAEDPYRYFTWTVSYGTASPLGVPKQVTKMRIIFFFKVICLGTVFPITTSQWNLMNLLVM